VTIEVQGRNDAPSANADNSSTSESAATTVDVLSNDTDPDGDALRVASVDTTGTQGTVTITNGGADLRYDPAGQFTSLKADETATDTFSYKAGDGTSESTLAATVTVTVVADNAVPVLANAGSSTYTENDPATTISSTLTVADADDTHFESARVKIAGGLEATDELSFAPAAGITAGTYDSGTGILTLTGHATTSDWQQALRDVKFRSASDHPGTSRTIEFTVNDGTSASNTVGTAVTVTRTNDGPAIGLTNTALPYDEGDGPVQIDTNVTITDPESDQVSGAAVDAGASWEPGQDELAFNDTDGAGGINLGIDDDPSGTLTLTGTATNAQYEAAIEQIFYTNNSDNPNNTPRVLSATVTDVLAATGAADTRNINVNRVNDAPLLSNGGTLNYTANGPPTAITSTLTVTDIDDTHLLSAQVAITAGHESDDDLSWVDNNAGDGITLQNDNNTTDVISLTGTGTLTEYRDALRAVRYQNTGSNPTGPKQATFSAHDGDDPSNNAIADININ
jgi:VCBS repeat-containing protein